jgi:hypothetical protein
MKRLIAEWLWRAAVIGVLCWIGLELHQLRQDVQPLPDDQATASSGGQDIQQGLDDLREDVARIDAKVDALMQAMMRLR